ncbi:MAG TPA: ribonuclease D [Flavobacteriales bacterium]|nr:ribonuclease D [Flavobacteriales bacterium]HMR26289.1 ribonuclease D [Flavobacteriales bacterium]
MRPVAYSTVNDQGDLARMTAALSASSVIALDTEASSFHRYKVRVCLVQVSDRDRTWLVDPFAAGDLAPLGTLLARTDMEVVIHDADYDLRMLAREQGIRVENVFDTLVAAELLNEPEIGLASLLQKYMGIQVDKKFQKADWSKRPLPEAMLDYAAGDTAHLIALRDILEARLKEKGRWSWAREEFALLTDAPFNLQDNLEPGYLRLKGAKLLKPHQLAVLREVHAWREGVAERMDRAPFMVIGNEVLLDLAKEPPADAHALASRKGMSEKVMDRHGRAILEAVRRGALLPRDQWPRLERPKRWDRDPEHDERLKRLKAVRDRLTAEHDLRMGIVASNQLLQEVARSRPGDLQALSALPGIRRYQVELFGADLLAAV